MGDPHPTHKLPDVVELLPMPPTPTPLTFKPLLL
jgi:hypothetical protein